MLVGASQQLTCGGTRLPACLRRESCEGSEGLAHLVLPVSICTRTQLVRDGLGCRQLLDLSGGHLLPCA